MGRSPQNNYDLLRLVLATIVVLVHASALSGAPQFSWISRWLNSDIAVLSFFAISGMLISQSYERSTTLTEFTIKRVRRIWPAYLFVVLFGIVLGVAVSRLTFTEYVQSTQLWRYLLFNLCFLNFVQPSLPGVFEGNLFSGVVNGSLWSIRSELMCYALVPLLFRISSRARLASTAFAMFVVFTVLHAITLIPNSHFTHAWISMVRLGICECGQCFCLGVMAYSLRGRFRPRVLSIAAVASMFFLFMGVMNQTWIRVLLGPCVIASMAIGLGQGFPSLGNFGKHGDFSYGVYIFHFPIIQLLVSADWFRASPYTALVCAVLSSLLLSFLSWRYIEAPWLARGNHYRDADTKANSQDHSYTVRCLHEGICDGMHATDLTTTDECHERRAA